MKKIGILASYNGSGFETIQKAIETGILNAKVEVIITNNSDAGVLKKASKYGIKSFVINKNLFPDENLDLKISQILKTYAVSRILLDNIPNIKAYWATSTVKLALIAQEFGANDVDGTIEKESIQSAAGAKSKHGVAQNEFVDLIKNSGFIPVERDSVYNELKVY